MLRKALCLTTALLVVALMVSSGAVAQEIKGADINNVQPPNFRLGNGDICSSPNVAIPDNTPDSGVTDTLVVECPSGPITDLDVLVQISHTWVGDLEVTLTKQGGPSAIILDRPGLAGAEPPPGSCCGCGGNDVDATFDDSGVAGAESMCFDSPAIMGNVIAGEAEDNTLMATFNGEDLCGTWDLRVTDGAGADTGTLNTWCLTNGDGGPDVPASGQTAMFVLIGLLMLGSTYYMIRRRQNA